VTGDKFRDEVLYRVGSDAALRCLFIGLRITACGPLSEDTLGFDPG